MTQVGRSPVAAALFQLQHLSMAVANGPAGPVLAGVTGNSVARGNSVAATEIS